MKKNVVVLTLLLLGSIAGTYAVYELYVKGRMRELGEHLEEEKQLQETIARLETTFYHTKPETVLRVWREQTQPWADTVDRRSEFYNLGDIPLEVEIPEEEFPKFYYKKVFPDMIDALIAKASQSNLRIPDPTFGSPAPDSYRSGTDPSAEEISDNLARFEFGKSIAELMIDAGVLNINTLAIWPERVEIQGRNGDVKSRTTGLGFTIPMRNFVQFMDKLSQEDRYFEVKALQITNKTLRDPEPNMNVQIVLSQAYYRPAAEARDISEGIGSSDDLASLLALFGRGSSLNSGTTEKEEEGGLWERIKGWFSWLPFF